MLPENTPEPSPPPIQPNQNQNLPEANIEEGGKVEKVDKKKIIFVGLILLSIIAAVYFLLLKKPVTSTTTSTSVTTIHQQLSYISSCSNISVSGIYYLEKDINFKETSPCIVIKAENVKLFGNGHLIKGYGPFLNISPFSYGIIVNSSKNVVITNLTITNCSYGIFVVNSSRVNISANLKSNVVSGILLKDSKNINFYGNVSSSTIYGAQLINSSSISLNGNIIRSGVKDLMCDYLSGMFILSNSSFTGSCLNNSGCEFAICKKNYPINLEPLKPEIEGCGIITKPGNYYLLNDIFIQNISNFGIPCLDIRTNNVTLYLNNKKIVGNGNSIGIQIINKNSVSIKDGVISKNKIGVNILGSSGVNLKNVVFKNNENGIFLNNSNANNFVNINFLNNSEGSVIQNSLGNVFKNVSSFNNSIGFQLEKYSVGNFFEYSNLKNKNLDFSCDNVSGGKNLNTFTYSSCGIGNCLWANCTKLLLPQQKITKIDRCMAISSPGNYSLASNLLSSGSCLQILSSNVNFSCNGFLIQGNGVGNGILINGNNVNVTYCKISNFENSILAKSSKIIIDSVKVDKIDLQNVNSSTIINVSTSNLIANKLKNSIVVNSSVTNSFLLNSSELNKIIFVKVKNIIFLNGSKNNSVSNSNFEKVLCDSLTNNLNQNNGVSTCASKTCTWFVCTTTQPNPCQAINGYLTLFSDYVISAPTCFTVFSNDSTLDCNFHTLLGNSKNTLAFVNASRFTLKNCNIKNFSNVAKVYGVKNIFQNLNISNSLSSITGITSNSIFSNITIFSSPNISISGSSNLFNNVIIR
ncbi:MAG: NosD domain-containing protein [Candidatus Micrarchaeia archaeon]